MRVGQQITNAAAGDSVTFIEVPTAASPRLVMEMRTVPGGDGPPLHLHPRSAERFEVIDGALGLELDGERLLVGAGEAATVPPGVPHRFFSAGDAVATTRVSFEHGGHMGEFLETFYELARAGRVGPGGTPSILQIAATFAEFHDDIRPVVAPWPVQRLAFAVLAPVSRLRGLRAAYRFGELEARPACGADGP